MTCPTVVCGSLLADQSRGGECLVSALVLKARQDASALGSSATIPLCISLWRPCSSLWLQILLTLCSFISTVQAIRRKMSDSTACQLPITLPPHFREKLLTVSLASITHHSFPLSQSFSASRREIHVVLEKLAPPLDLGVERVTWVKQL